MRQPNTSLTHSPIYHVQHILTIDLRHGLPRGHKERQEFESTVVEGPVTKSVAAGAELGVAMLQLNVRRYHD